MSKERIDETQTSGGDQNGGLPNISTRSDSIAQFRTTGMSQLIMAQSSRLGQTFLNSPESKQSFNLGNRRQSNQPPNITFFKQKELGSPHTLMNAKSTQNQATIEANQVETRVRQLQREEQRMIKRINQTRTQALKMQKMTEESNERYLQKLAHQQFMEKKRQEQAEKNKLRREQSIQLKESRIMQIKAEKQAMYQSTKEDQAHIKDERNWINDLINSSSVANYKNQRNQEERLKFMKRQAKEEIEIQTKQRYDSQMLHSQRLKQQESQRLLHASQMEEQYMNKLQNTITVQKQALQELENAMARGRIQKKERFQQLVKSGAVSAAILSPMGAKESPKIDLGRDQENSEIGNQ